MSSGRCASWREHEGSTRTCAAALVVALLLGGLARLPGLGHAELWTDELISWATIKAGSVPQLLELSALHRWPPLVYLLLRGWVAVTGWDSALGLRLPTALLGVAAIAAVFWAGRRLAGGWSGTLAALLVAVAPAQIWMALDNRFYPLFVLQGALLLAVATPFTEGRGSLPALVLLGALSLYSHDFAAPFLLCLLLSLLVLAPGAKSRRRILLAGLGIGLLWLPWLLLYWQGQSHPQDRPSDWQALLHVFSFLLGWIPQGELLLALALLGGVMALLRQQPQQRRIEGRMVLLLTVGLGPALLALLAGLVWRPFLQERYLAISSPAVLILLGAGLTCAVQSLGAWLRPAQAALAPPLGWILLALLLLLDPARPSPPIRPAEGWEAAARFITLTTPEPVPVLSCSIGLPLIDWHLHQSGWGGRTTLLGCHPVQLGEAGMARLQGLDRVWLVSGQSLPAPALLSAMQRQGLRPMARLQGWRVRAELWQIP